MSPPVGPQSEVSGAQLVAGVGGGAGRWFQQPSGEARVVSGKQRAVISEGKGEALPQRQGSEL